MTLVLLNENQERRGGGCKGFMGGVFVIVGLVYYIIFSFATLLLYNLKG